MFLRNTTFCPVFKKMTLAGLNNLWQKSIRYQWKIGFLMIHSTKKGLVLVSWVLEMIKPSESVFCLMKWGCRGHWGHWGCWGYWGHWGCRGVKAWKIPTEDFRVIQESEFSFILCFEKKSFWVESLESWYIMLEAVEASRCHFFENWWGRQNIAFLRNI